MFVRSFLIAAAILSSSAAVAQEASIRYRPYELASAEGREAVSHRIKSAVRRACYFGPWAATVNKCRRELSSQLLFKIGNAELAALYQGKPVQTASRG